MSRLTYRQDEGLGTHGEGAVRVAGGTMEHSRGGGTHSSSH